MSEVFECMLQVRFGHVDPAGIAYFPRIFDYIHDVFEELWEKHVGVRYYHLLQDRRLGMPLVHSDVDFSSPLSFGDRPIARVTCFKIGRSSLGLRYVFRVGDRVCVTACMTTAFIDLDKMKSLPIPPEFRSSFERLLEDGAASEAVEAP
ncbi:MAG: 4-hydroxybenzoyl-CoA thioesterase [Planctomycetota bacterium]|jgi:4-hydroxybenzoyl-CoA thioesterase